MIVFSVCVVFLVLSLITSKLLARSVLTPLGIFAVVWNGLLILFEMRFVAYTPVSHKAYALLLGSYAVFFLGAVTAYLGRYCRGADKAETQPVLGRYGGPKVSPCNLDILYGFIRIYGLLSATGLLVWSYELWTTVGAEAFMSARMYRELGAGVTADGWVGWMLAFGLAAALLAGIYISYGGDHGFRACLFLFPIIVYSLVTGARAAVIWALLLLISPLLLALGERTRNTRTRRGLRWYIIWTAVALVVIAIAFGVSRGIVQRTESLAEPYMLVRLPAGLLHLYIYATGPFAAFSWLLDFWGAGAVPFHGVLTPLAKIFAFLGIYDEVTRVGLWASIPFHFNTFTYLADWYIDFGLLGIIIGPYLLGVVSTCLTMYPINRHPVAFAWASFILAYLAFAFTGSITSANAAWVAIAGSMVAIYGASNPRSLTRLGWAGQRRI